MTTTITAAVIPASEHATGFVAVAQRFPHDAAVHRIARLFHRPDGTQAGMPARLDGSEKSFTEVRPACRPDSDPADQFYELSTPTALARGGVACPHSDCFGDTA